jgi:hypothetical protein
MTTTRGQHCSAPPRHRLNQISHIVSWTSMCFHGLPNRRTWIPLNIWIDVCASDNVHLRPSINSAKCCNRNGEKYQETMWENWLSLCRGGAEQWMTCRYNIILENRTDLDLFRSVCDSYLVCGFWHSNQFSKKWIISTPEAHITPYRSTDNN